MTFTVLKHTLPFLEQGRFYTTYRELFEIFGKPTYGPGEEETAPHDVRMARATCMWFVKFDDATYAVIYDNRQKETNYGWYNWFIGGMSGTAFKLTKEIIEKHRENKKAVDK
jgi:hypothetical protein